MEFLAKKLRKYCRNMSHDMSLNLRITVKKDRKQTFLLNVLYIMMVNFLCELG